MCTERTQKMSLGSVLAAAGVFAAAVVAWRVLAAGVAAVVPFVTLAILAACVAGTVMFVRLVKYGNPAEVFRRHRRVRHAVALPGGAAQTALPAPPLMLEQAPPVVHAVITGVKEKTR